MEGCKKIHCGSSTSKLMSKFLLICSIFNIMALPICVCGVVSELSMSSSFLCLLKENQILIEIDQPFSCLSCLSIVSLSWFKCCPSILSWLFVISYPGSHIEISFTPYQWDPCTWISICPTILFILTGLLGVSASYSPTRSLYVKFCVHLLKPTP